MTNHTITRKYGRTLATALCLTGIAGVSNTGVAAPARGLDAFDSQRAAAVNELPPFAKANAGVVGKLNGRVLSAPVLDLTLPDGTKVQAHLQRVARDDNKSVQSWVGTFDDSPGSSLVISKAKGVVTGFVNYQNQTLELRPAAGGNHVLFAVDTDRLPQTDTAQVLVAGGADVLGTAVTDYGTGGTSSTTGSSTVVHDVLILYTAAAATRYGQATIESMIQSAVEQTNQAYLNSGVNNLTLNVVGLQQTAVTESSGMGAALNDLKSNSTVRSLRDKLAADLVIMISENTGSCGQSVVSITNINGVTNTDAYAVSTSSCLSQYTLAHELGHLQRLDHNRENAVNLAMYAYSYGYRLCGTGGFRDIMSYPCTGAPRVLQFSNPNVDYNGAPTGVSYEADPANSAENARTLINTATMVAAYRVASGSSASTTPVITVPTAPSSLVGNSVAYNSVTVGWRDNSSNESGFKLQRSADGVNFSDVATLGAGAASFTDAAVSASTSYYYRVSAYNSAGGSAYSNTLSVTTPAAPVVVDPVPAPAPAPTPVPTVTDPPATPTAVAAFDDADGSALVSWTDASINEQGFEVRRETWNSKRKTWTSLTSVGTVPANLTSMIDLTGSGTYRYTVRAVNTAGGSSYAGPAQVTVTSGTTTSGTGPGTGKGKNH